MLAKVGMEILESEKESGGNRGSLPGMIGTQHEDIPKFEFVQAQEKPTLDCKVGLGLSENEDSPMAMSYVMDVGWTANKLGPNSGHWKRRARAGRDLGNKNVEDPIQRKREGSISLGELVQDIKVAKRRKNEVQGKEKTGKEIVKDGGEAVAARQHRRAQ